MTDSRTSEGNLLTGLSSLGRMSRLDQTRLANRLRTLSLEAKTKGATTLAANLLRATYELEKAA